MVVSKFNTLISLIALTSCIQSGLNQVRIVDSNGNPAKINKIVPAFNEQQMIKQKEAFNNSITEVNKFRQNFNEINEIQNVNTVNNDTMDNDTNIIKPSNRKKYPEDIFADRITNYKYLDSNKNIQVIDKNNNLNNKVVTIDEFKNNLNKVIETSTNKNEIKSNNKNKVDNTVQTNNKTANNKSANNKSSNNKNNTTKKTVNKNNIDAKGFYIQIGIFNEKTNAENSYKKYSSIHKGGIDEYISNSKVKYKVLLGPYSNKNTAEKDLEKVIKTGHYDVYITEKK